MRIRARLIGLVSASLLLLITSVGLVGVSHNYTRRAAIEQAMAAHPQAAAAVVGVFGAYFRTGHRAIILVIASLSLSFAYVFGRATVRQIDALRQAALRIAGHGLDVPVRIEGNRQAEALARSLEHVRLALRERVALEEETRRLEAELQSAEALHRLFLPQGSRVRFGELHIASSLDVWPNGHFWAVTTTPSGASVLVGRLEGSGPSLGLLAAALLSSFRVLGPVTAPGVALADLERRHRSFARGTGRLHAVLVHIDATSTARWASLGEACVIELGDAPRDVTGSGELMADRVIVAGLAAEAVLPAAPAVSRGEPSGSHAAQGSRRSIAPRASLRPSPATRPELPFVVLTREPPRREERV